MELPIVLVEIPGLDWRQHHAYSGFNASQTKADVEIPKSLTLTWMVLPSHIIL